MIRGPLPREAIRLAIDQAGGRGTVMDRDLFQRARLGFIIFCMSLTVFVRVRRSRSHILRPEDIAAEFPGDVRLLRSIPQTSVISRELWLLAPWGTWQYFRILDDRIIEIRSDGVPLTGFSGPAPADGGPGMNPGGSKGGCGCGSLVGSTAGCRGGCHDGGPTVDTPSDGGKR